MELKHGDLVTITCEYPYGLQEEEAPKVKGNVGVILDVYYYDDSNKFYYGVHDTKGNIYDYASDELILASASDIANALREMLE